MNEQLNILNILDMLLRKWTTILMCTVIVGVFSFVFSEMIIPPQYSSTASLYVNSSKYMKSDDVSSANLSSSRQLVMTYGEILSSRTFLENIALDVDPETYSVAKLKSMITMDALNNTEILSITVKGENPDDVYDITKAIIKFAPDKLMEVVEAGSVKILDDASIPHYPVSPNIRLNTFLGVLIGFIFGCLIIIVLELFDTRIKSADEIIQRYEEPLLGEIPSLMAHTSSTYGGYSTKTKGVER